MALKYAVLGLLLERRGYGYDLMQRLESRLGPAWQLNPSTVYAALDQLERAEMIVGLAPEPSEPQPRPTRRIRRVVYEATEEGARAFDRWIADLSWRQEPIRGELQLKVATARAEDVPSLLAAIDHAELVTAALYEECRAAQAEAERDSRGPAGALNHSAAVLRLEGEMSWLREIRASLSERPPRPEGRRGRFAQPSRG